MPAPSPPTVGRSSPNFEKGAAHCADDGCHGPDGRARASLHRFVVFACRRCREATVLWVRGVGTIAATVICAQSGVAGWCSPMRTQVTQVLAARSRNTPPAEAMTRRAACRTDRARAAQIGRGLAVMEVRRGTNLSTPRRAAPEPRRPPGAPGRSSDPRPLKASCLWRVCDQTGAASSRAGHAGWAAYVDGTGWSRSVCGVRRRRRPQGVK